MSRLIENMNFCEGFQKMIVERGKEKKMDVKGLGPLASSMQNLRSTTELNTLLKY